MRSIGIGALTEMINVMLLCSFFFWSFNCLVLFKLFGWCQWSYWQLPSETTENQAHLAFSELCWEVLIFASHWSETVQKLPYWSRVVCVKRLTGFIPNPWVSQGGSGSVGVFFFFQWCNSTLQSSHDDNKARKHFDLLSLLCLLLFSDMLCTVEAFQQLSLEGQILKTCNYWICYIWILSNHMPVELRVVACLNCVALI